MERLTRKRAKFIRSLNAFDRNLKVFFKEYKRDDLRESLVASCVKHFEISYESAWQFLQVYLIYHHQQQVNSAKKIFRECFAQNMINAQTTQQLIDMSEARNATVHDYDEETALETCKRILGYYEILRTLEKL